MATAYLSIAMPDGSTLLLPRPTLQAIAAMELQAYSPDAPSIVATTTRRTTVRRRRPAELDDADRDPRLGDFFPKLRVPKSPVYSTPAEVTARCIEKGSGAGADIRAALKTNGKVYRELRKAIDKGAGR